MFLLILSAAWLTLFSFFLFRFIRVYFNRETLEPDAIPTIPGENPFVTVIVPARNESANIEACLYSLLTQSYPFSGYKVVVVDDNSTDDTREKVREVQARHENLDLLEAGELPPGWSGKNHACWRGVKHAQGQWFCFVDADTRAKPELLRCTLSFAESEEIDLLSLNPFQELVTVSEKAFLPATFLTIASRMDFKRVNSHSDPAYGANGQFLLFRRSAYEALNGHYGVKNEIMDDMAFARLIKRSGFRLYWIFGEQVISTRMYRGLSHIWEGFSKNMMEITHDRGLFGTLLRSAESLLLGWLPLILPVWAVYAVCTGGSGFAEYPALALSLAPSLGILLLYLLTLRALKVPLFYGLFYPLGFTLSSLLTAASLWKQKGGRRKWKGRVYV